jgi:hypothetical protein
VNVPDQQGRTADTVGVHLAAVDDLPEPTIADWLDPDPSDMHPEGGFEPRAHLAPAEADALDRLAAAGAVEVWDVTAEPGPEPEILP